MKNLDGFLNVGSAALMRVRTEIFWVFQGFTGSAVAFPVCSDFLVISVSGEH